MVHGVFSSTQLWKRKGRRMKGQQLDRGGGSLATTCSQMLTLVNVLVIRDWMLLVVVLKFLQIWAMRRAAKSRRAQWLSTSGRRQSCRLTMQVITAGISS